MSEIQRYETTSSVASGSAIMNTQPTGRYVLFTDHQAVITERDSKISELSKTLERLMAAVQLRLLTGIPKLHTVNDVVTALKTVTDKLSSVLNVENVELKKSLADRDEKLKADTERSKKVLGDTVRAMSQIRTKERLESAARLHACEQLLRDWLQFGECFCAAELAATRGRCEFCKTKEYFVTQPKEGTTE